MTSPRFFVCSANDIDQSSGRGEKQHEETEQEHHLGRIKPYYACCSFCVAIIFCCIPVVQNFATIGASCDKSVEQYSDSGLNEYSSL